MVWLEKDWERFLSLRVGTEHRQRTLNSRLSIFLKSGITGV